MVICERQSVGDGLTIPDFHKKSNGGGIALTRGYKTLEFTF
jgi:hypothetical protein